MLTSASCNGDEENLMECGHSSWGYDNCGSSEHVYITCGIPEHVSMRTVMIWRDDMDYHKCSNFS